MTAVSIATLSQAEARSLTDEVKHDAERLWRKLVELYDGGAHLALGYSSWGAYFKAEFGGEKSQAYRILDAGRVVEALHSPNGEWPVPSEAQARELAPLLDQPEQLREAWAKASANGEPTAVQVREVVEQRQPSREITPEERDRATARDVTFAIADAVRYLDRPAKDAAKVAAMFDPSNVGIDGEDWTPQRFARAGVFLSALTEEITNGKA